MEKQNADSVDEREDSDHFYFPENKCYLEVYYRETDGKKTVLMVYFQALKALQEAHGIMCK